MQVHRVHTFHNSARTAKLLCLSRCSDHCLPRRRHMAGPQQQTCCCSATPADSSSQVHIDNPEAAVRSGWDPAGILPPLEKIGDTDHFARRAKQRQQQQQQPRPQQQLQSEEQQQQKNHQTSTDDSQQHAAAPSAAAAPTQVATAPGAPGQSAYGIVQQPAQPAQQTQQQQQQQQQQHQHPPGLHSLAPASAVTPQAQVDGQQPVFAATVASVAPFPSSDLIDRVSTKWLAQGGIPAGDRSAYDQTAFLVKLAEKFIPINLDYPGLRILNFDPAMFTVEGFMTPEECESWQQHAEASGCLQQSKIGGGNAGGAAAAGGGGGLNSYGARRTSSSLLLDQETQVKAPGLQALMQLMQRRGCQLLAHLDSGRSWGPAGRMPAAGQFCYESPQVARYLSGQHFLAHEDAFPTLLAAANGFQRHATLLVYLNDVAQGGATHFDHLGLSVQPRQGTALLFFPAYADGTPDARSLHTAQDAQDTKWVMQQWVARGYPVPKAVLKAVKVAALAGPEAVPVPATGEPVVREVFRVVASSSQAGINASSSRSGDSRKSKNKQIKKASKKGFSR